MRPVRSRLNLLGVVGGGVASALGLGALCFRSLPACDCDLAGRRDHLLQPLEGGAGGQAGKRLGRPPQGGLQVSQ